MRRIPQRFPHIRPKWRTVSSFLVNGPVFISGVCRYCQKNTAIGTQSPQLRCGIQNAVMSRVNAVWPRAVFWKQHGSHEVMSGHTECPDMLLDVAQHGSYRTRVNVASAFRGGITDGASITVRFFVNLPCCVTHRKHVVEGHGVLHTQNKDMSGYVHVNITN